MRTTLKLIFSDYFLVTLAVAMMVTALVLVATGPDRPTDTERANTVCERHGGVKSLDAGRYSSNSVVCADGKARDLWD